jgi:hypothetical protein
MLPLEFRFGHSSCATVALSKQSNERRLPSYVCVADAPDERSLAMGGVVKLHRFLIFLLMFVPTTATQAAVPQLPCDDASYAYPTPSDVPTIEVWHKNDLAEGSWQPPSCTGWPSGSRSKLIVTLTGSFHADGGMEALLTRVGAISTLKDILFWSATTKRWGHLSTDASALADANAKDRRKDFVASDFAKGAELYYWEDGASTGATVYRLRVFESTTQRLVISSENVTTVRKFIFTLFKPGALQSLLVIQRLSPNTFGARILTRTGEGASDLSNGHEETFVNRSNALFRQLAGIKTDQEPPAIR